MFSGDRALEPRATTLAFVVVASLFACSSAPSALSRVVAAHNAFESSQRTHLGPVVEGSLQEGAQQTIALSLGARCYTVAAFGGDGTQSLSLSLTSSRGAVVASSDRASDRPTLRYCAPQAESYSAIVRMVRGNGAFAIATWATEGTRSDRSTDEPSESDGTCRAPHRITLGATVEDTTRGALARHRTACGVNEANDPAPDVVYAVEITRPTLLRATVHARWPALVSLRSSCVEVGSELACGRRTPEHSAELAAIVGRGTYWLVVDGDEQTSGEFSLEVQGSAPPSVDSCADLPPLLHGVLARGTTVAQHDRGFASCSEFRNAPDTAYRLDITARSRVRVTLDAPQFAGTISLYRGCAMSADSELSCARWTLANSHTEIDRMLEPGSYTVVVDGETRSQFGSFELRADVLPEAGGSVAGDRCSDAIPIAIGTPVEGDTFATRDDLTAACGARQGAFDQVFRFDLPQRSQVNFELSGLSQGATLFVVDQCNSASASRACRSTNDTAFAGLDTVLAAGRHYLVVEASRAGAFGRFVLESRARSSTHIERLCAAPPLLGHNTTVSGVALATSFLPASCDADDADASMVYRLVLDRRSTVTLTASSPRTSQPDGSSPSVSIRRDCFDSFTQLACAGVSSRMTTVDARLDRGTYWITVSGSSVGGRMPFTLRTIVDPIDSLLLPLNPM